MYEIKEIEKKEVWEKFLLAGKFELTPFFQSWNWGEVQKELGNTVFRFGLYKNKKLVGICSVSLIRAKRGTYLHLRHGPLLLNFKSDFKPFFQFIKKKAGELGTDFIRVSPLLTDTPEHIRFFKKFNFRNAPIHNMDAENAWVLDLNSSEEELLKNMRKTTRYLVRKAQTVQLEIKTTNSLEDFQKFEKIYNATSIRHHFVPHRGMKEELEMFSKDNEASLFVAKYKKRIIAGALVVFYGNQAVYHHGASSDGYKDVPATYLLQWEAIKEAKKRGKKLYNFWGVVPPEKPNHPWKGITLFKTGFGGRAVNFVHAQDLPLSRKYWKAFLIETYTRIKKGY